MSLRQSSGYKAVLVLASIACLIGAGYIGYKTFIVKGGSAAELKAAEQAFARGNDALGSNPQEATVRFHEATLLAEKGLNGLGDDIKKGVPEEERKANEGKLNYLRAQALRDHAYAKAKADGKPLDDGTDGSTGEKYRSYTNIKEADPRQTAILALRKAFELMPENPDVIRDLTRVELSRLPLDWPVVEPLLRNTIKLKPEDARAHYFLAKFEFEQPSASAGWAPTPADKRDAERVGQVRDHLEQAKKHGSPYWRTALLEAELLAWQLDDAKKSKNKSAIDSRRQALDALLYGEKGALAKAIRGDHFTALSLYDVAGIFGVHAVALHTALGLESGSADRVSKLKQASESLVATAGVFCKAKGSEQYVEAAGEHLVEGLVAVRPTLVSADPAGWAKILGGARDFLKEFPKAESRPTTKLKLASLKLDDAAVNPTQKKEMEQDAIAGLEAGLKAAMEQKLPPEQLVDYHATLAMTKLLNNRPAAEVEGHVVELKKVSAPQLRAKIGFIEGVLAERQGKLEVARKLLEGVTNDKDAKNTPLAFYAIARLAAITLVTGDANAASGYLNQVADVMKQPQKLDPSTRAWLEQSASSVDEVTALQVKATVGAGLQRIERMKREQPNQPIPVEVIRPVAEAAERLAKPLRAPTTADRTARLAIATFYLAVNQGALAEKSLATLATDYPDSVEVLRASVAQLAMTETGKKELDETTKAKVDDRIQQFLKANAASRAGKLFWAEWLSRTKRSQQAADFLRDPKNFPDPDPVVSRLLANALFNAGDREEARKILGGLTPDPTVDLMLVRAAATKEESEKGLQSALTKYENNGMLRLYDAASKMNQNKFDEAIREFRAAKEYSQVKAAATAGLTRALIGYAGSDPNKALPVIHGMITESPEEAGLFQAAALGALYTDDIGLPNDQWGAKKSMYAAVNRWEQLAIKAGDPATTVGLTKAQYHTLAGNPTLARQEAIRVSGKNPNHVPTLLFLTESFLAERDFDQAQKYLDRANTEAKADDPTPALLEGAVLEGKGDLDAAAKLYERLMTQYAGNPAPFARRIAVATAQQKPGDALMWANKWVEKSPTDPSAILEQVIQLAKADPKSDAAVKKADEFVAKQVEAGEAQLKAAKPAPTPENAAKFRSLVRGTVMLQTATAFSRARNFPEAKKRVDVVLKEMPDSPAALLIAGDIAMIEQKWDDAAAVYQKRLDTDKRDFIAANNLAWVLAEKKNNPTGALKLVSDVRASRGGKPVGAERLPADFLDTIGTVYLKLNDANKFPEMRDTFEGAVKRYPTDPRMHSFLGQAYAAIGDNTNAVKSLKTAVRLASDPTVKAVSAGQKEEAKKAAEAALKKFGN
jgi:Tfp pilus assembly protein PilF